MILLTVQTNAEETRLLKKSEPAPYTGILIPQNDFYEYESCMDERSVCIGKLEDIPQPINLNFIKTETYLKVIIGAAAFGLCSVVGADKNGQGMFGTLAGCGLSSFVLTSGWIFD